MGVAMVSQHRFPDSAGGVDVFSTTRENLGI